MEKVDYKKLGFKCGVEIHQQVYTEKKLFCNCPAGIYSKKYNAEVLRHMRPTLSEMGVYDGTALMEFKTKKEITYRLNNDTVCTYEMDDTPPFLINQDAVDIVIEIGLLLNSSIVNEMHIARKQYLDGSIPTGFQRTAIVSMGGELPFKGKKINIRQIAIEEDSCREVSDIGHNIVFKTDRLGMPLIEVVTEPEMHTPEEAAEVVREIGRLMRVTGKVRRGIGAVRQDVNVSITGGRRVEIKGVPRYQDIPKLVKIEALRQKALLEIKDKMKDRGITADNFNVSFRDMNFEFRNTKSDYLLKALNEGLVIRGIKLPKMSEILTTRTQPGKTFAHEISGRVRVIACLDSIPNLYHTDNWPEYKGWQKDWMRLKRELAVSNQDVAVVVWGTDDDVETACNEIKDRIIEALDGVPHETRQARFDGTTDFERILPGADRMYPDTDHPPVNIATERIKNIAKGLPEKPWITEERYRKWNLPEDVIDKLVVSPYSKTIEDISDKIDPKNIRQIGITLMQTMKGLSRKGVPVDKIWPDTLIEMFVAYDKGEIHRSDFPKILEALAEHIDRPFEETAKEFIIDTDKESLDEALQFGSKIISDNHFRTNEPEKIKHYLIGEIRSELGRKLNPSILSTKLNSIVNRI